MVKVSQRSFAAGELGPDAAVRSDLQKYDSAVRLGLNCIVKTQGGLVNRAGLRFIGEARGGATRFSTRLIDFEAESGDSYILEFSNGKHRIIRNYGFVVYPSGPDAGDIVVIDTPYSIDDVGTLKWTQSNDVMTFASSAQRPRELTREDHHIWNYDTIDFGAQLDEIDGLEAEAIFTTDGGSTSGFVAQQYRYRIARVKDGIEGPPSDIVQSTGGVTPGVTAPDGGTDMALQGNYVNLEWDAVPDGQDVFIYKEVQKGGFFGYIGTARGNNKFKDDNIQPDTSRAPREQLTSFSDPGKRPGVCEYHQQRMIYARTNSDNQTFWGTLVSSYTSMSRSRPAQEDDAFEFKLANRRRQEILWLVSLGDALVLMTKTAEWTARGRDTPVISAAKPPAVKVNTNYGSANLKPQLVGSEIIHVLSDKSTVRTLGYSFEQDALAGQDLTLLASHIFAGRAIRQWAYAGVPYRAFFFVFEDGGIAAMTYMKEQEIWGCTTLETDGFVEDVQTIQLRNDQAGVYFTIERKRGDGSTFRAIERLVDRDVSTPEGCFFVDCGLSFDNGYFAPTVIGAGPQNVFTVEGGHGLADGTPILMTYAATAGDYRIAGSILRLSATTFKMLDASGDVYTMEAGFAGVRFMRLSTVVTGLDHLEGRVVVGLVDGNAVGCDDDGPDGSLVVTGGSVTLPDPGNAGHIGLWYASEIETLDIDTASDRIDGVMKNLKKMAVRFKETRGVAVGKKGARLYPVKWRDEELYAEATRLYTGKKTYDIGSDWGESGVAIIRQNYPLPMHVLSITPDYATGE